TRRSEFPLQEISDKNSGKIRRHVFLVEFPAVLFVLNFLPVADPQYKNRYTEPVPRGDLMARMERLHGFDATGGKDGRQTGMGDFVVMFELERAGFRGTKRKSQERRQH